MPSNARHSGASHALKSCYNASFVRASLGVASTGSVHLLAAPNHGGNGGRKRGPRRLPSAGPKMPDLEAVFAAVHAVADAGSHNADQDGGDGYLLISNAEGRTSLQSPRSSDCSDGSDADTGNNDANDNAGMLTPRRGSRVPKSSWVGSMEGGDTRPADPGSERSWGGCAGRHWGSFATGVRIPQGLPFGSLASTKDVLVARVMAQVASEMKHAKDRHVKAPAMRISLHTGGMLVAALISTRRNVENQKLFHVSSCNDLLYHHVAVTLQRGSKRRSCAIFMAKNPQADTVDAHVFYFKQGVGGADTLGDEIAAAQRPRPPGGATRRARNPMRTR